MNRHTDARLECCYARVWGPDHVQGQAAIDRAWGDRPEASRVERPGGPRETVREALERAYGR